MATPDRALGALWGFAEADAGLVGVLSGLVGAAAIVYLARRVWRARR